MATEKITIPDDKLLNLVNNTIELNTEFKVEDFTGGSVLVTSTNNHTINNYKVHLFFGYANKKPITRAITIEKDLFYIWSKALILKVDSLKNDNLGMNYNDVINLCTTDASNKNSTSIVNKVKKSIVGVDLPIDLPDEIIEDLSVLEFLESKDMSSSEIKKININKLRLSAKTKNYILKNTLKEVLIQIRDNTKFLMNELKKEK